MRNTEDPGQARPWIPTDATFAARLALIRQRMGWGNVAEAAHACGLPVASWRNWERDGREPRRAVEIAQIIAGRTGCDLMWLLMGPQRLGSPGAITHQSSPLTPRVISRPPSRPRSRAIDDRRPAITPAARRRLAA